MIFYCRTVYASGILPGYMAFKLFDTHGLNIETIIELATVESLQVDKEDFEKEMNKARLKSKVGIIKTNQNIQKSLTLLTENDIPQTDDSFKYIYEYKNDNYEFPKLRSKVIGLLINGINIYFYSINYSGKYLEIYDIMYIYIFQVTLY